MASIRDLTYDSRVKNESETLEKIYDIKLITPKSYQSIISGLWKMFSASWGDFDAYHAHDIEALFCLYPAALVRRKILVYDSHEIWTRLHAFSNLKKIQWLFNLIEKIGVKKARLVITVNQSVAHYLKKRYHKPTVAIYNYPKKENVHSSSLKKRYPGKKLIIYVGGFNEGRGLEETIEAAKFLPNDILIIFMGYGNWQGRIEDLIKKENLQKKVLILKPVPPEKVIGFIRGADLGLCLIQKTSLSYYYSSPNKIYQYVAAEIPILGSDFPEISAVVKKYQVGVVIEPNNPKMIAKKIIWMLESKRKQKYQNNLKNIKNKFTWEEEEKKLVKIYEKLVR